MKYVWFEEYATSKKGAYKEYKSEWEVDRYMIRDKMFAMHGGDNKGKEIITLKLDPMFGLFPRRKTRIYGRGNCRQDLGFRLESDGHVSKCDLCFEIRKFLITQDVQAHPDLAPESYYRQNF